MLEVENFPKLKISIIDSDSAIQKIPSRKPVSKYLKSKE